MGKLALAWCQVVKDILSAKEEALECKTELSPPPPLSLALPPPSLSLPPPPPHPICVLLSMNATIIEPFHRMDDG